MVAANSMPVSAAQVATQRALARERLGFLTDGDFVARHVRPPILASWHRSRESSVPADEVVPVETSDLATGTPLHRAADPVLRGLAAALDGQPVSVILTDRHGLVLSRLTADRALERRLDRVHLAPGFDYGEESVGTNGIGTALEVGGPTHVFGHEHFAERLEDLACAGVPIRHPVTGRTVGLVDLTCWQRHAGSLLMALAATTAHQVQDELMQQSALHERELLDEYLRTCRRSSGIVMAVSDTVTMLNDHSREVLSATAQQHLLTCASEALAAPRRHTLTVDLPDGERARLLLHHLGDGTHSPGLVVRVVPLARDHAARRRGPEHRETGPLPGLIGSGPVWQRACAEVEHCFVAGEWVAVTGPQGSGRRSIVSAVQLRGRPVRNLVTLDATGADGHDWVTQVRTALDARGSNVLLREVDRLSPVLLRATAALLQSRRAVGADLPWVAVSVSSDRQGAPLLELLDQFPVSVPVPPLRLHAEDVPALVHHFTLRAATGQRVTWSDEAMQVLVRATWPGNVEQLHQVVRRVLSRRRSGSSMPLTCPPRSTPTPGDH